MLKNVTMDLRGWIEAIRRRLTARIHKGLRESVGVERGAGCGLLDGLQLGRDGSIGGLRRVVRGFLLSHGQWRGLSARRSGLVLREAASLMDLVGMEKDEE